ncbi:MAG: metal-dependent hydrolase [Alkalilacustris sp.]
MKIIWLGHSGFRIETGDTVLLIDPWVTGNPMFPEARRAEAIAGATHILVSHGHGDHSGDAPGIARETGAVVMGVYDLMTHWAATEKVEVLGFNKGGTVTAGSAQVTMVSATHSSSLAGPSGPVYAGAEAGFMIAAEGHVIYFSGDTDVMADMDVFAKLHKPDIGILAAGGHFTMDMQRAAWAAKTFFDFDLVIPCHYKTFPLLAQSAEAMVAALPGVKVVEPEVLVAIEV